MTRELRFLDNEPFCDHNFDNILIQRLSFRYLLEREIDQIETEDEEEDKLFWVKKDLGNEWTMNEIRNYRIFLYIKVPL